MLQSVFLLCSLLLTPACSPSSSQGSTQANRQSFPTIYAIEGLSPSQPVTVSGDLSEGSPMADLRWAANSSVACFPMTRAVEFQGNQVYYQVEIPRGYELNLTVTPTGKRRRINLFGYLNFNGDNVPPLNSVISCEAGYELYVGTPNLNKPGKPQKISFGQAVNRGFTVFVGVSGAKGVTEGTYELTASLRPR